MLTEIQKLALSKIKVDRDMVRPGDHDVDFTIHVKGVVKVGEDYARAATGNIPWLEASALWAEVAREAFNSLISKVQAGEQVTVADLEAMRDSRVLATNVLTDCIKRSMLDGESAVGTITERVEGMSQAVNEIKRQVVSKLPAQEAKGMVKVSVTVDEVASATEIARAVNPV